MKNKQMNHPYKIITSPVGILTLVTDNKSLTQLSWENPGSVPAQRDPACEDENHPLLLQAAAELKEYFAGKRQAFTIDVDPEGTEFQKKVWKALLTIPFGKTKTYGEVAVLIENPDAVRAVGGAANKNPVPVIIPCHRVIGADGKLVGFGGGLKRKEYLLEIEGKKRIPTLWDL
jgi:methylated-DNA-[protein]-cysteine S-methyltransferase